MAEQVLNQFRSDKTLREDCVAIYEAMVKYLKEHKELMDSLEAQIKDKYISKKTDEEEDDDDDFLIDEDGVIIE